MSERGYVKGKLKKRFLTYLIKQQYISKSDIIGTKPEEREAMRKAGLEDALFFKAFYTGAPWQTEYLKMIGKRFKVSVYLYDIFGDKRTHKKIA